MGDSATINSFSSSTPANWNGTTYPVTVTFNAAATFTAPPGSVGAYILNPGDGTSVENDLHRRPHPYSYASAPAYNYMPPR